MPSPRPPLFVAAAQGKRPPCGNRAGIYLELESHLLENASGTPRRRWIGLSGIRCLRALSRPRRDFVTMFKTVDNSEELPGLSC